MIVPQEEIDLINGGTKHSLWLPAERGSVGQRKACPLEQHTVVKLQPRAFVKGTAVTITETALAALTSMQAADAKEAGYKFLQHARDAYARSYGVPTDATEVWVVRFVLGNHSAFYADHAERYLKAKMGGGRSYTVLAEQAAHGEGAVPREDELKFAKQARVHREAETHRKLEQTLRTVRAAIADMDGHELDKETREVLRWMRRRAGQLERRLEHAA